MIHSITKCVCYLVIMSLACLSSVQAQNGLNFDGTNDYVQTTYPGVLGSANRTFEAWIYLSATNTSNIAIVDYGVNVAGSRNTFLVSASRQLGFISGGTNANIFSGANVIPVGQWTHVAFVLNGGTGFLYVNGFQVGTGSLTSVNTPGGNINLRIGQRVPGGNIAFQGTIDEVRIWNEARTPSEIMNNMNSSFCTIPANLMAYYRFEEGVAGANNTGITSLPDLTGNGYNGALINFSLNGTSSNWVNGATVSSGSIPVSISVTACSAYTSPSGNYVWTTSGSFQDTVFSPNGCDSIYTVSLTLDSVTADFSTTSALTLCPGDTVSFTDNSAGGTSYFWLANSALFSQTAQSSYVFNDTGMVDITLIVSNQACSDTSLLSFMVSGPAVSSSSITNETCSVGMDGAIDIEIVGGTSPIQYIWSNGSMSQDVTQLPGGTYSVLITDSNGCTASDSFLIDNVLDVVAGFALSSDPSLCPGETVMFTNSSQMASTYEWKLDGQVFSQATDTSYTFPDSGSFLIELVASEGICADSTSLMVTVNAAPELSAAITGESCPGSMDGAIDLTVTGGADPFTFDWSNSATTEDLQNLSNGLYEVVITDTANCLLSDTFEIATLGGVDAAFSDYPTLDGVQFLDESVGDSTITSWHWTFGTGIASDTSNIPDPLFDYPISGTYEVCLFVEDLFGCQDSICQLVSFSVGLEPSIFREISLYPNPGNGRFTIDLNEQLGENIEILVYDFFGKEVYQSKTISRPEIDIDLTSQPAGLYQVLLLAEEKKYIGKLVIR